MSRIFRRTWDLKSRSDIPNLKEKVMYQQKRRVRVRMEIDFDSFDMDKRDGFLEDLSVISGCSNSDIDNVSFVKGCVVFGGDLPDEAAEKIFDLYDYYHSLSDEDKLLPMYKEIAGFVKKYNVVSVVDMSDSTKVVKKLSKIDSKDFIIFVHGWRGDESSFGDLPSYLEEITNCKVLIYNYPTGLWEHSPSVIHLASNFENWVRNQIDGVDRKVAIVAHSLGGIIVRKAMANQLGRTKRLDKYVKHLTFVASPYTGVPIAELGAIVPAIRKAQISDLSPNSPMLTDINSSWRAWLEGNVTIRHNVRSIYGTADMVVNGASSSADDPQAVAILKADHISIIKPDTADDDIVQTLARFYKDCGIGNQSDSRITDVGATG